MISFSQHLLTKSNTLLKTPKSRKMAQIEIIRDPKYRFRLQKGVKNHKYFFGFWKCMTSAFKRTFNRLHTMVTYRERSYWKKLISIPLGVPLKKKTLKCCLNVALKPLLCEKIHKNEFSWGSLRQHLGNKCCLNVDQMLPTEIFVKNRWLLHQKPLQNVKYTQN